MKKFFLTILGWVYLFLAHIWMGQDKVCTQCGWKGRRIMADEECPRCKGRLVTVD